MQKLNIQTPWIAPKCGSLLLYDAPCSTQIDCASSLNCSLWQIKPSSATVLLSAPPCCTASSLMGVHINHESTTKEKQKRKDVSIWMFHFGQLVSSWSEDKHLQQLILIHCLPSRNNCIHFLQIRFLMKTYSFLRETAPVIMKNAPKEGIVLKSGVFSLRALSLLTVTLPETRGKNDLSRTLQVTYVITLKLTMNLQLEMLLYRSVSGR